MGYPDNFNAYLYDKTIGSDGEGDAPPKVDEVARWRDKEIGFILAHLRTSYSVNFRHCNWDAKSIDVDVLRQMIDDAAHHASTRF